MHTYTALYDTQQDAETAQRELAKLGIVPVDATHVAGREAAGFDADPAAGNRTFWESIKGIFVPHEDRSVYEEGVRQGGWLLTVNVDDQISQRVHDLLESTNAVNVDEREAQYRAAGSLPAVAVGAAATVPVLAEELVVGKRRIEQGGVRVRSYVVSTPVEKDISLREERVVVDRHAVDQRLDAAGAADAFKERTLEVRTQKEEPTVAKQARVVEEVQVGTSVDERVERVVDTVRRTEVVVEKIEDSSKTDRR